MATVYNCDLMQFFLPGTVTTPGLAVIGDADTGIFSPGADILAWTAGGIEAFRFTETTQDLAIFNNAGVDIDYSFLANSSVQSLFLDGANGRAGMNTTAPSGVWHTRGLTGAQGTWYLDSFGAGNADFSIRQAEGTVASPTVTVAGRNILRQLMYGYDGAAYKAAAEIRVIARGTIGSDRVPGALLFFAAEDAAGSALVTRISLEPTETAINDEAKDIDTRIEAVNSPNAFGVDAAGAGFVYFGPDANGARMQIKAVSTTVTAAVGATATATNLIPANAKFWGVTTRITTTLGATTGTTGYTVGDGVDADRWGTAAAVTSGTTTAVPTAEPSGFTLAAANVVLTATGGNFDGTGVVRVTVHYTDFAGPTS